ncbi:MAG: hypothetical protein U1F68_15665 [Gammaproteobacteria bacterium]
MQNENSASIIADPFNLDALRLTQAFEDVIGVKKLLTTVPVRKPSRQEFIRVRPGDDWKLDTPLLTIKEENEFYLIRRELWSDIQDDVSARRLVVTITRQGVVAVWPLKLPDREGRLDAWSRSALDVAARAESAWVKLQSNRSLGAYDLYEGSQDLPEPVWPDVGFQDIIRIAFRDFHIQDVNHPALKRLRGEV